MAFFVTLFVGDKIVHNSYNEIKFYNFIAQAKDLNIITKKDDFNCDITYKKYQDYDIKDIYLALYDYLLKQQIIIGSVRTGSLWTWTKIYTINPDPDFIEEYRLRILINENNYDYPDELKCYNIDYTTLSEFLKNYNHKKISTDLFRMFKKNGGKNSKTKKRKNEKTKKINGKKIKKRKNSKKYKNI
jgi:hypothetical protein